MDSFLFALNATMPVFLLILLGFVLRQVGLVNDAFSETVNKYVFKCALPVNVYLAVAGMDVYADFDIRFCLFCFVGTAIMFLGIWGLTSLLMKDRSLIGAFSQAAARSSAAILGIAFATQIYGDAGMVPMMIISAVPLFNILSVVILCFSPHKGESDEDRKEQSKAAVRRACINVLKNPLVISLTLGGIAAVVQLHLPGILMSAANSVSNTSTPLALIVVGASFTGRESMAHWKLATLSSVIKLLALPAIYLPLAALLGFRGSELIAILIMTGSPTTVTCYVMAKSMDQDGELTANAVVIATLMSSVTITFWIAMLRMLSLI